MFKNQYELNIDIKKKMTAITPTFVQYDNAILIFRIFDNGKKFDLTGFTKAEVAHQLKSGAVILGEASIEGAGNNQWIKYAYSGSEMDEVGFVNTSLSIYSDSKRVSTQPFKVEIVTDLIEDYAKPSAPHVGALQKLIATVEDLRERTMTAIEEAKVAAEHAQAFADDLGYKNAFNLSFSYKKNNVVSYNGSSYMAIKDNVGKVPIGDPTDENWRLIARKGEDGEGIVTLHKDSFISAEGQTVFTLSNTYDQVQNRIHLVVGGTPQYSPENFMETSSSSVTLNEPLRAGISVTAIYFGNAPAIKNDLQTQITGMTDAIQHISDDVTNKTGKALTDSKIYTDEELANLVGSSPETLDTLYELATALGNDPNFATTVANQIGKKVDKIAGKQLSTEDFTTEEKAKLNKIESEANKFIPPVSKFTIFLSEEGQTTFTITGGYIDIRVIVGGVEQFSPNNFTRTSSTVFTLSEPLKAGTIVEVVYS